MKKSWKRRWLIWAILLGICFLLLKQFAQFTPSVFLRESLLYSEGDGVWNNALLTGESNLDEFTIQLVSEQSTETKQVRVFHGIWTASFPNLPQGVYQVRVLHEENIVVTLPEITITNRPAKKEEK